ncbi:hypothetical protein [Streptomyces nitrosporeus]|uniref:hypothetical protein n=1 Tax=Streptomyces nitrosporeus TaxID=28894 RepID=UPI00142EE837|nr:hypothetical protein [Streptomyces nitrosporeus]GGZ15909.1 hypothetical protein GCM10010327_53580 [Streptomyces nitrosporeus]
MHRFPARERGGDTTAQRWRVTLVEVAKDLHEPRPVGALDYRLALPGHSLADCEKAFTGQCA